MSINPSLYYEVWRKKSIKELEEKWRSLVRRIDNAPPDSESVTQDWNEILYHLTEYINKRKLDEEQNNDND